MTRLVILGAVAAMCAAASASAGAPDRCHFVTSLENRVVTHDVETPASYATFVSSSVWYAGSSCEVTVAIYAGAVHYPHFRGALYVNVNPIEGSRLGRSGIFVAPGDVVGLTITNVSANDTTVSFTADPSGRGSFDLSTDQFHMEAADRGRSG